MSSLISIIEPEEDSLSYPDGYAVVGIDLGTTNSLVATHSQSEGVYVIADNPSDRLLPSAVCYTNQGTFVGHEALKFISKPSERVFLSIKRYTGQLSNNQKQEIKTIYDEEQFGAYATFNTAAGKKSAIDIAADILLALKKKAEFHLNKPVRGAVITVPSHFNDSQRQATRLAAHRAGLPVLRLINEPTAAAIAYGLDKKKNGYFMIYDLGGGTFDVSLLHLSDSVFEVIATGGSNSIGGDDFDRSLFDVMCSNHKQINPKEWSYYRLAIRSIKEKLSSETYAEYSLLTPSGDNVVGKIGRQQFEEATNHLLQKTISISSTVIHQSGVPYNDLDGIVLVGGSTLMPAVYSGLKSLFGKNPLNDIDPSCVVAIGAASQAHQLVSPETQKTLLLDITPLPLGIEVMGGLMEVIVPKHTTLPTTKEEIFTTFKDGQTGFDLKILQGERERAEDCHTIGLFHLSGLPPRIAGSVRIRVIFQIDVDGLLSVTAESMDSNHMEHLETSWSDKLSHSSDEKKLSPDTIAEDAMIKHKIEKKMEAQMLIQSVDRFLQHINRTEKNEELVNRIAIQNNLLKNYLDVNTLEEIDIDMLSKEVEKLQLIAKEPSAYT
ncbi:Hsp70 family protein [Candidatus Ichthyocystis hellenicum]|uniref:Hsp70 family protein n=1 Tax=Candidatus Ichthyocystis hellenicum TaxID=1561003 RepID=UPI000ADC076F|nr:Hsp70 family protein [Candidatus Ichthyocystis hellenicum]